METGSRMTAFITTHSCRPAIFPLWVGNRGSGRIIGISDRAPKSLFAVKGAEIALFHALSRWAKMNFPGLVHRPLIAHHRRREMYAWRPADDLGRIQKSEFKSWVL